MSYRQRILRSLGSRCLPIVICFLSLMISSQYAEGIKTVSQLDFNIRNNLYEVGEIFPKGDRKSPPHHPNDNLSTMSRKMDSFKDIVLKYIDEQLNKKSYEIISGLKIELNTPNATNYLNKEFSPSTHSRSFETFNERISNRLQKFAETHVININIPRAMESTGRLFFFKGLKKFMWPLFIGMQIAKTVLLALFLPSIIGSLGKIVGKGLTSVSGFTQQSDTVEDLDFKDLPQDNQMDYNYMQGGMTNNNGGDNMNMKNNFVNQMYDSAAANNAVSRYGMNEQKLSYLPAHIDYSRNSNMQGMMTNTNDDYKIFHDIPASSMLLTNYDPFYSPLLSRLDAVFQQLGLGNGDEKCREKLVCLMYASPAKYAPYSNLISAQLSRELNELKKPTTDNSDILRFFKYMRAAKEGQDHGNCDAGYIDCTTLKDSDSPAMITTFNDINKLVQARKF